MPASHPRRVPTRAGQHARAPRSAPPKREGRRITGHVTSLEKMHRGAIAPYWIITAWIGIPGSGAFLLASRTKVCRGRPQPHAGPAPGRGPSAAAHGPPPLPFRRRNWEGRRAFISAGPHGAGTYYMGWLGGRRGWRGMAQPPISGQRAMAIANHGPLTEAGRTPCGWWVLLSGSVAGLRARRVRPSSSPFPGLQRACALVGDWRLEVPR